MPDSLKYDPAVERDWTQKECVQLCVMCTLADAMKMCQLCPFSIGRAVRMVHLRTLAIEDSLERERFWQTLNEKLWDAYLDYLTPETVCNVSGVSETLLKHSGNVSETAL